MKKILILSLLAFTFACSSNKDGASNPNKTQKEFEKPTGELTSANVKKVVLGGIAANSVLVLRNPTQIFNFSGLEFDDCTETSGDMETIEWDCVFNNVVQCSADGTTVSTDDDRRDFVSIDYNEFEAVCNQNDPDELSLSADGDLNFARNSTNSNPIFCADIEFETNDITKEFDGCRNSEGFLSVRLDDKNFVVRELTIEDGCTDITAVIRDKNGTETFSCTITSTDGACNGPANILTLGTCLSVVE